MERKKWETAIRCLDIALHPNTSDDEVIAGVNGFRRTAEGTPLGEICRAVAGADAAAATLQKLDRLNRENRELRRRLELAEIRRIETDRNLAEGERRARELSDALARADHRADEATREFATFRAAAAEMLERARQEKFMPPRRAPLATPVEPTVPAFRHLLAAARQDGGDAADIVAHPALTSARAPSPRTPWTA